MRNRFVFFCAFAMLVNVLIRCNSPNHPSTGRLYVKTSGRLGKMLHHFGRIVDSTGKHEYEGLENWLTLKKATLVPAFPGIKDEELQTYFQLKSTTPISPQDVNQFLQLTGIEAAYEKANEELPQ